MNNLDADKILEQIDIVDVISRYLSLKKKGKNFWAKCPFHKEKTASFSVSSEKQIYKCFGCGKGGNAISFIMDYEKLSFIEALKKLAEFAGITLHLSPKQKKAQSKKNKLYETYKITSKFFQENLNKYGKNVIKYLQNRKISNSTIQKFQLGYSLDSYYSLKNYLLKKNIEKPIMAASGLFSKGSGELTDIFRNRLMFPIHSLNNKVIAFGGRILVPNDKTGKYINTPTTEIYHKGSVLYGLSMTKYEIGKVDEVLIAEGYMDFLRLYEAGFTNSVACLGTSLTDNQIKVLGRFTDNLTMMYDGDKSGKKAAVRAALNILRNGFNPSIVELENGEDPDSYILKYGVGKLKEKINNAKPLIIFLREDEALKLSTKEKLNLLIEYLNGMDDKISQDIKIKEISEIYGINEYSLRSKIKQKRIVKRRSNAINLENVKYQEEKQLLSYLIKNPEYFKKVCDELNPDYFFSEVYKKIYNKLVEDENILDKNKLVTLVNKFEEDKIRDVVASILLEDNEDNFSIEETIILLKIRKYQSELREINKKINNEPDNAQYFQEKKELKQFIKKLSTKVVTKTLF